MKRSKPDSAPGTGAGKPAEAAQTGKPTEAAQTGAVKTAKKSQPAAPDAAPAPEVGGRDGPDPTRFGDWEKNGRCVDF